MPMSFKYAVIEINGKPVLVDQKAIADASEAFKAAIAKVQAITDDVRKNGFALQTPDGMKPVTLGSAGSFATWAKEKMDFAFNLVDEAAKLPPPLSNIASTLLNVEFVVYSASLFYTGKNPPAGCKALYGEIVLGFQVPTSADSGYPLALREVVITVNNYS